jgi:predicted SnoaL-like aldol condensation-catalyzing enzyme
MQKRFTVYALTMLSITCEAALADQLTSAQKIDRVTTLLNSLETRNPRPLAYIGASYTQHNLQVADGDYVVAQTDYNFGGPKEGLFDAKPTAFYDLYRIENGRQVEHWDVLETIPPSNQWKNSNGKF